MDAQPTAAASAETPDGTQVTEHIRLCPDGVYRWYYELSMLKNPIILFTTWKLLGGSFGAVYLFVLISSVASDALYGWRGFLDLTWGFLLLTLAIAVIAVFAYLIVAWCCGWKYVVLFEMDEKAVRHIQVPRQFKKTQALAWLSVCAGLAANMPAAVSAGLQAAERNTSVSEFEHVKRIALRPRQNLIKINRLLARNQVYAAPEDYEFVRDYLTAHCPKARAR